MTTNLERIEYELSNDGLNTYYDIDDENRELMLLLEWNNK